jgi:hypothetical protein
VEKFFLFFDPWFALVEKKIGDFGLWYWLAAVRRVCAIAGMIGKYGQKR